MSTTVPHNSGVHLHALIDEVACRVHNVPQGISCYFLMNEHGEQYATACGSRIKKAGFNGKISPQSVRNKAPVKRGADQQPKFSKSKSNVQATRAYAK